MAGLSHTSLSGIDPVVSTSCTAGDADDPAIWIHPSDPSKTVIIGTDKTAGIYVWDINGNQLQHIPQGTGVNNVDVRYGMQLGSNLVDIVVANLSDIGKLAVFKVNPDYSSSDVLNQIADKDSTNNDIQGDSYGFCLYQRPVDGALFVFERPRSGGSLAQYLIDDDGTGNGIQVSLVRSLNYSGGVAEGFVADDELGFVYIAEESGGIHKYYADPDTGNNDPISLFATNDGISGDREGLGLYKCDDGLGYLVLSSQGNSTLKVYERLGINAFLKTVEPLDHQGSGGLQTDGVDATSLAITPNFPNGLLVIHDGPGKKFHLYDWADVAENDLTVCTDGQVPDVEIPSPDSDSTLSDSTSGGGGGCFIATAAYGSYAEYDNLRAMVRLSLLPVMGVCWTALKLDPSATVTPLLFIGISLISIAGIIRKFKK